MSIGEIIAAISAGVLCLGTFIEVSKIKINPWSSLFKWIGNCLMADVNQTHLFKGIDRKFYGVVVACQGKEGMLTSGDSVICNPAIAG